MDIGPMRREEIDEVAGLWRQCGLVVPWNDPAADIALARSGSNADILVLRAGRRIAASVLVGHDGHRGWVYYVSVNPDCRGLGYGRAIMAAAEAWLAERKLAKAQLMIRPANRAVRDFYAALGYAETPRVVMAKWFDGRTTE
jgi:hypothetical protein